MMISIKMMQLRSWYVTVSPQSKLYAAVTKIMIK